MKGTHFVTRLLQALVIFAILPVFFYGCASSPASLDTIQGREKGVDFTSYENLKIETEAKETIEMQEEDLSRIADLVQKRLNEEKPGLYTIILDDSTESSTLVANIQFTRYEPGSACARFFLAGLGQIHIDAIVTLKDKQSGKVLSKHEVKKTFAWGGLYGVSHGIKDVEPAFAETVVNIILGKETEEKE